MLPMTQMLVPLWCAVELGMSATQIGVIAGAGLSRAFFSIHSGALLDRLGVRKVSFCALLRAYFVDFIPHDSACDILNADAILTYCVPASHHRISPYNWLDRSSNSNWSINSRIAKTHGTICLYFKYLQFRHATTGGLVWDIGQVSAIGGLGWYSR